MTSFSEMVNSEQARRDAELQAQAAQSRQRDIELELLRREVLQLGQEVVKYLEVRDVPHINFFEETTEGELTVPGYTYYSRGRRSNYPPQAIQRPVYKHLAQGWFLYGHSPVECSPSEWKRVGITTGGVIVNLQERGKITYPGFSYSIDTVSGQQMCDEDKIVTDIVRPDLAKEMYDSGRVPESVIDLTEGKKRPWYTDRW